jgi:hypothetical protein
MSLGHRQALRIWVCQGSCFAAGLQVICGRRYSELLKFVTMFSNELRHKIRRHFDGNSFLRKIPHSLLRLELEWGLAQRQLHSLDDFFFARLNTATAFSDRSPQEAMN